ncbi:hypothetical protein [Nocardiopsis sp. NPDC057823]|uniref:hypothetical protein n=1 Tax=Nocardiopsis sp. NPDC057823 TaxID=3346256 RepID=UPI00366AA631
MSTGTDVLAATDWNRTFHAYGPGTDVPGHLALLLSDDPADRSRALDHLYSAVIHQGTVYSATVPAARYVAGVLADPRLDAPVGAASLRAHLLGFLRDAAEGVAGHLCEPAPPAPDAAERDRVHAALASDDEDEALGIWEDEVLHALMYHEAAVALRDAAPELYAAVRPHLTHHDGTTRIRAVEAAGALALLGGPAPDLSGAADMAETREEGAVIVLVMGETGGDTTEFLTHSDPAIRACAALAPGQRGNPAALAELLAAAGGPEVPDAWFAQRPAYFAGSVRAALLREAARRCGPGDAERMLPVFRALAPAAPALRAGADLGPMLEAAFPAGAPARPDRVQREYLRVLADSALPWTGAHATGFAALLERLGLPGDRDAVRALAAAGADDARPGVPAGAPTGGGRAVREPAGREPGFGAG